MGLGRVTRFAPTPAGARRVNVMRAGRSGVKELAPPPDLFADFQREKAARRGAGADAGAAHLEAFQRVRYRSRYREHVRVDPAARGALDALLENARSGDLYVMCMCPYRTPGEACHTYLLLELAREMAPGLEILPEPPPRPRSGPRGRDGALPPA